MNNSITQKNDYEINNKETGLVVLWVELKQVGYTIKVLSIQNKDNPNR